MLKPLLLFFAIFVSVAAHSQTVTLNYFTASPDGSDVVVTWEVPDEAGISNFKILRKIDDDPGYKFLEEMKPDGKRAYQYADYTIFKEAPKTISYKLQVYRNGMIYTFFTSIVHNPTSVQRTWGSIKSMFR